MTPLTILSLGTAFSALALCGWLLWALDARTQYTKAVAAENKQLRQIARDREAECVQLAEIVRESEAAYAQLQESLAVGRWVRLPSDEQIEAGVWP